MRRTLPLALILVASLLLVGATGTVVSAPGAGASGHCDDGNDGGGGEVHIGAENQSLTDDQEAESTARGFALVAVGTIENGEPACDSNGGDRANESDSNADYLEAHADTGQGVAAQFCVDSGTTSGGSPVLLNQDADHDGDNPNRECEYNQDDSEEGRDLV